jgi:hypothetical protein
VAPLEQPSVKSLPSIALGWHPLNQVCLQVYRRQLVGWRLLLSPVDEQGQDCALYAFCVQMLLKVCIENKGGRGILGGVILSFPYGRIELELLFSIL